MAIRLSPAARLELRRRVDDSGSTLKELSASVKISLSTLKNILSPSYRRPIRRRFIECLAVALGTSLKELESPKASSRRDNSKSEADFNFLASTFATIDASIMPILRGTNVDPPFVARAYDDLLTLRSQQSGLDLKMLRGRLNSPVFWSNMEPPTCGLSIQVADNLEAIAYRTSDAEAEFARPVLLRNCLCEDLSDSHRKCPLHSHSHGEDILARFDSGVTELRFLGLSILFRLEKSLWPPSMDSLAMVSSLNQAGVFQKNVRRVLDLGSGTGLLGLAVRKLNPLVTAVHLSDWMLSPLLWGSLNCFRNQKGREHVEVRTILGLFDQGLDSTALPYDLCLCNPPYLPEHNAPARLNMGSAVYGTSLLRFLISNHRRIARQVYVQFSNLALPEAIEECKLAKTKIDPVGKPLPLPFKISYRKLDPTYRDFLLTRGLIHDRKRVYPYWHQVQLYRLLGE